MELDATWDQYHNMKDIIFIGVIFGVYDEFHIYVNVKDLTRLL